MRTTASFLSLLLLAAPAWGMLTFSPNKDGIKDEVTFKLKLDPSAKISSWLFEIKDKDGSLVKSFKGKGRPPEQIVWGGKDVNNRLVTDGTYFYALGLVTPAGNQTAIAPSPLLVDRVLPTASSSVDPEIFSPNGDGTKDETQFNLQSSDSNGIHSWLLLIKDPEGAPARSIRGRGAPPGAVRWDGRGDFEEDVPDGTYTFELQVHDLAGNKVVTPAGKVVIDRAGQVSTVEVDPLLFSPNGDGFRDEVKLKIISAGAASVESWELMILNRNGKVVRSYTGKGTPPSRIDWNGMNEKGKLVDDGPYQVVLTETDRAGNKSTTTPQPMEIDTAPPIVEARLEPDLLSPNGDGYRDKGIFRLKAEDNSPLEEWKLDVFNDVGRIMKTLKGPKGSKPRPEVVWDGTDESGKPLNDGSYSYSLAAKDIGGNKAVTPKAKVRVDRAPPLVNVTADSELFSPNADGVLDALSLSLSVVDASPLESWKIEIKDIKGKLVRSLTGPPDQVPPSWVWDGKNDDRMLLPDGDYTYVLSARDIVGNKAESPAQQVVIGATRPEPVVRADLRAISPNADGYKDEATFTLSVQAFNKITAWALKIVPESPPEDSVEPLARTFQGRGDVPNTLKWGGERDDKRALPDGEYQFSLETVDAAGNKVETLRQPIRIDTRKPDLTCQISPDHFSPNKDGTKDEAVFIPSYKDASPIADWKVIVFDAGKTAVWEAEGKGQLPLSVPWKGRGRKGERLPDGRYNYVYTASDDVGNRATTPEALVRIDNTPPEVTVQADPDLFSPNADGVKDETTFLLDSKDASDISNWHLTVWLDKLAVRTFKGIGRPTKSFPWDGANDRGRPAQDGKYRAVLTVTDEVGNTGESEPFPLRLDTSKPMVTVEAETDKLEELIPQMTVEQKKNKDLVISLSSEVLFDTGQAKIKSAAYPTLMKATYLIRRYPLRKVRVEGHADNVPIHNEEFADNLELSAARAKSVMEFFVERGKVDAKRMSSAGHGAKMPKASNATPEGRRQNRRVEIILMKEGS